MFDRHYATNYLKVYCEQDDKLKANVEALDTYDFGKFLTHGRSLSNLQAAIEKVYDNEFYDKFGFFVFDYLMEDEIIMYFMSRYNVSFQEFIDYVVRHDNGQYETAHKIKQE